MAAAVTISAPEKLDAEVIEGRDAFLGVQRDWRRLTDQSPNPFLRWEWVAAWASALWPEAVVTVVVRRCGETIAIAPFVERRYALLPKLSATCLQLLGPREVRFAFELPRIAGRTHDLPEALAAIVASLQRAKRWDWLEIGDSLDASEAVWELGSQLPHGLHRLPDAIQPVPVMTLRRSWEHQRSELGRNVKESIRHSYNSLKREAIDYTLRIVENPAAVPAAVENFLRLHAIRAQVRDRLRHANAFGGRALPRFLRATAPALVEAGLLRIAEVEIGGTVIASRLVLDADDVRYLYYSGFDPAWWRFGVMTLITTELVKDAIARGMSRVNFSPGVDQSKVRWNVDFGHVRSCFVVRSEPSGLRLQAVTVYKAASAAIKRRPALESIYYGVRRGIGI